MRRLTYYFQQTEHGGRNVSLVSAVPRRPANTSHRSASAEPNDRDSDLLAARDHCRPRLCGTDLGNGLWPRVEEAGQRDQTDLLITLEYSYEFFPTFTAFTFEDEETQVFNQEVRLVSTGDSRINWIVGGFFNANEYDALSSEFTPGYGAFAGFRQDLNDLEYFEADRSKLKELAVYGEIGFDITERWTVTVGARYYDYQLETANDTQFPYFTTPEEFQPYPLSDLPNQLRLEEDQSFNGDLYKFNTSYSFDDGNLVYFTFSQGYRVGASNGGEPCPDVFVPGNQNLCLLAPGQEFGPNPGDIAPDQRA